MQRVREALAFPMYATAAWLAWVLGRQNGVDAMLALSLSAAALGCAAWSYGQFVQQGALTGPRRVVAQVVCAAMLALALVLAWPRPSDEAQALSSAVAGDAQVGWERSTQAARSGDASNKTLGPSAHSTPLAAEGVRWQPWSEEALSTALAAGHPVFVDFTAAWCVSCLVNERLVLQREPVIEAFAAQGVVALRADWTRRDQAITKALARQGRNGVPLYLLIRPGEPAPQVLPELLTVDRVLQALGAQPAGGRL
jgi:thiol:disulfide interchange protein